MFFAVQSLTVGRTRYTWFGGRKTGIEVQYNPETNQCQHVWLWENEQTVAWFIFNEERDRVIPSRQLGKNLRSLTGYVAERVIEKLDRAGRDGDSDSLLAALMLLTVAGWTKLPTLLARCCDVSVVQSA